MVDNPKGSIDRKAIVSVGDSRRTSVRLSRFVLPHSPSFKIGYRFHTSRRCRRVAARNTFTDG